MSRKEFVQLMESNIWLLDKYADKLLRRLRLTIMWWYDRPATAQVPGNRICAHIIMVAFWMHWKSIHNIPASERRIEAIYDHLHTYLACI